MNPLEQVVQHIQQNISSPQALQQAAISGTQNLGNAIQNSPIGTGLNIAAQPLVSALSNNPTSQNPGVGFDAYIATHPQSLASEATRLMGNNPDETIPQWTQPNFVWNEKTQSFDQTNKQKTQQVDPNFLNFRLNELQGKILHDSGYTPQAALSVRSVPLAQGNPSWMGYNLLGDTESQSSPGIKESSFANDPITSINDNALTQMSDKQLEPILRHEELHSMNKEVNNAATLANSKGFYNALEGSYTPQEINNHTNGFLNGGIFMAGTPAQQQFVRDAENFASVGQQGAQNALSNAPVVAQYYKNIYEQPQPTVAQNIVSLLHKLLAPK